MRKRLSIVFGVVIWFSVIAQFIMMFQNRVTDVPETVIRFFSFFTILTNTIVALYFTGAIFDVSFTKKPGLLTALTAYIFMVGIVYQILLRHLWQPAGIQFIVDESLHTLNPLLVIIYWYLYEKKWSVNYSQVKLWLVYPLGYMACVLIRGRLSGFYPYPFINVVKIGLARAIVNSGLLTLTFVAISCFFIFIGRKIDKMKKPPGLVGGFSK